MKKQNGIVKDKIDVQNPKGNTLEYMQINQTLEKLFEHWLVKRRAPSAFTDQDIHNEDHAIKLLMQSVVLVSLKYH